MNHDLLRNWDIIRKHLTAAVQLIDPSLFSDFDDSAFNEYLEHNELELACEVLSNFGREFGASVEFWQELDAVADLMKEK